MMSSGCTKSFSNAHLRVFVGAGRDGRFEKRADVQPRGVEALHEPQQVSRFGLLHRDPLLEDGGVGSNRAEQALVAEELRLPPVERPERCGVQQMRQERELVEVLPGRARLQKREQLASVSSPGSCSGVARSFLIRARSCLSALRGVAELATPAKPRAQSATTSATPIERMLVAIRNPSSTPFCLQER